MLFWWICRGESVFPILLLRHLGAFPSRQHIKKQRHHLLTKVHIVKAMVFPVAMYRCECWTIKKTEHQRIDTFKLLLKKTLESPMDCKEIKPVNPKRNQPWILIGRTDAEAEAPILKPPDAKSWFIGKDSAACKDWRQKEKRVAEDKMVR